MFGMALAILNYKSSFKRHSYFIPIALYDALTYPKDIYP